MAKPRLFGYRIPTESGELFACRSCGRRLGTRSQVDADLITMENVCGYYKCSWCGRRLWRSRLSEAGWVCAFGVAGIGAVLSLGLGQHPGAAAMIEASILLGLAVAALRSVNPDRGVAVASFAIPTVGLIAWWMVGGLKEWGGALKATNWAYAGLLLLLPIVIFGTIALIGELGKWAMNRWRTVERMGDVIILLFYVLLALIVVIGFLVGGGGDLPDLD